MLENLENVDLEKVDVDAIGLNDILDVLETPVGGQDALVRQ